MIKLGIFILPNSAIKKKILFLKNNVKKKFGIQTYLNHLPHCTMYVFQTSKRNFKKVKKIKKSYNFFIIQIILKKALMYILTKIQMIQYI